MRSFNATFNAERAKRGTAPVNLVEVQFASGTVYLSDRDVTPSGGQPHLGLVKQWGFIDSDQAQEADLLGSVESPDLELTIINSGSPAFSAHFDGAVPLESTPVLLWQWFKGTPDSAKELLFTGYVSGEPRYTMTECQLTIGGLWAKMDRLIGTEYLLTPAAYPAIDPDDIGRMGNIVYGGVDGVVCRCLESGGVDTLAEGCTASSATLVLSSTSELLSSGTIGVDEEKISYTGKTATTLTGCTRGALGTVAQAHAVGSNVWQVVDRFVYQVAAHPVAAIGDCYVDGVRITIATKYTGQPGNELAGYEGQAVFTVPARLTRAQSIDILVADGITVDDAISITDGVAVADGITISDTIAIANSLYVSDGIGVSDTIWVGTGSHSHAGTQSADVLVWDGVYSSTYLSTPGQACDSSTETWALATANSWILSLQKTKYQAGSGPPQYLRYGIRIKAKPGGNAISMRLGPNQGIAAALAPAANSAAVSGWIAVDGYTNTWSGVNSQILYVWDGSSNCSGWQIVEVWVEFLYTPSFAASDATGVAKYGAATKSGTVSQGGTVSKSGTAAKSGTVSKSGTVTRSGAVSKNGTVTISGNSVADVEIGQSVTANVPGGVIDDATGSITGTANLVIARPDHVVRHLWSVFLGGSLDDFSTDAGSYYAAHAYAFALVISAPVQASTLFARLAMQCRSRFMMRCYGQPTLLLRQIGAAAQKAITKEVIRRDSLAVSRTDRKDLINSCVIHYDLEQGQSATDSGGYRAASTFSDPASIALYGVRDPRQELCFDAVRSAAMIDDVGGFLLAWYGRARRMPEFSLFLDNLELEPGDRIALSHDLDAMTDVVCEVISTRHVLGSGRDDRIDRIEIIAIENGV